MRSAVPKPAKEKTLRLAWPIGAVLQSGAVPRRHPFKTKQYLPGGPKTLLAFAEKMKMKTRNVLHNCFCIIMAVVNRMRPLRHRGHSN